MDKIELVRSKLNKEAANYPLMREKMSNERGFVYCANRVSHMIKHDGLTFSSACANLESELEGMD